MKLHPVAVLAAASIATAAVAGASAANLNISKVPTTGVLKPQLPVVVGTYKFTIDSFSIKDTRSRHDDTDYVTIGITGQANQEKPLGDVNNGDHAINLSYTETVASNANVTLSYLIANSGTDLGYGFSNVVFGVGMLFDTNLDGLLAGGCDGVVAQGHHTFSGVQLAAGTAGGKTISGDDYTAGSDSPTGCGANSRYYVKWTIKAVQ